MPPTLAIQMPLPIPLALGISSAWLSFTCLCGCIERKVMKESTNTGTPSASLFACFKLIHWKQSSQGNWTWASQPSEAWPSLTALTMYLDPHEGHNMVPVAERQTCKMVPMTPNSQCTHFTCCSPPGKAVTWDVPLAIRPQHQRSTYHLSPILSRQLQSAGILTPRHTSTSCFHWELNIYLLI